MLSLAFFVFTNFSSAFCFLVIHLDKLKTYFLGVWFGFRIVLTGRPTLLQIVDLATLTGACVVALGPSIAGKDIKLLCCLRIQSSFITIYLNLLVKIRKKSILVGTISSLSFRILEEIVELNLGEDKTVK